MPAKTGWRPPTGLPSLGAWAFQCGPPRLPTLSGTFQPLELEKRRFRAYWQRLVRSFLSTKAAETFAGRVPAGWPPRP
jgi:hypothetical protein